MNLAYEIEKRGAARGDYPEDWPIIATRVKALAGWCCERCHVPHNEDEPDGTMLTVHHLDGDKWNCEWWNLAALCQRCHLRVQARVEFYRIPEVYDWETNTYRPLTTHTLWMARHVKSYNAWAFMEGRPEIPLSEIVEKDYDREWPRPAPKPDDDTDYFHRPDGSEIEV